MHINPAHPSQLNTTTGEGPPPTAAMTSAMWPCVQPVRVTRACNSFSTILAYFVLEDISGVKSSNRPSKSCTMCFAEGWETSDGPSAKRKNWKRAESGPRTKKSSTGHTRSAVGLFITTSDPNIPTLRTRGRPSGNVSLFARPASSATPFGNKPLLLLKYSSACARHTRASK